MQINLLKGCASEASVHQVFQTPTVVWQGRNACSSGYVCLCCAICMRLLFTGSILLVSMSNPRPRADCEISLKSIAKKMQKPQRNNPFHFPFLFWMSQFQSLCRENVPLDLFILRNGGRRQIKFAQMRTPAKEKIFKCELNQFSVLVLSSLPCLMSP